MSEEQSVDTRQELQDSPKDARYWKLEIELASANERKWRDRARKVLDRYSDEKRDGNSGDYQFNILYANTEILKSAVYQTLPKPDVRRRFKDKEVDPQSREIARLIERSLSYCMDSYDVIAELDAARDDHLLVGRGFLRVDYEPEIVTLDPEPEPVQAIPLGFDEDLEEITEYRSVRGDVVEPEFMPDGMPYVMGEPQDELVYQTVKISHVPWDDVRFLGGAKRWSDVSAIAIRHRMTRDELIENFEGKGKDIPLTQERRGIDKDDNRGEQYQELLRRAIVWEIWDKTNRERVWVAEGMDTIIEVEDDPYGLENFFPFTKPWYSIPRNDTLVPVPEFTVYQDQAEELDNITQRINKLTDALRVRGLYDGTFKNELSQLETARDNQWISIDNFAAMMDKGGLNNVVMELDVSIYAQVLAQLYQQREAIKQTIYEINGISDILRGASDPRDKATTQNIKAQFGSMRIDARTRGFNQMMREAFRIKAELIVEHFEPEILSKMTGVQVNQQMMDVMRDDRLRSYAVDIETDSTAAMDAETEKRQRTEYLTAAMGLIEKMAPMVQMGVMPIDTAKEFILFGLGAFKTGRQLEDAINQMQAPQQQQGPSPEEQKLQLEQKKLQMQQQAQQAKVQADIQAQQTKTQAQMALKQQEAQHDMALDERRLVADLELERQKAREMAAIKRMEASQRANQV